MRLTRDKGEVYRAQINTPRGSDSSVYSRHDYMIYPTFLVYRAEINTPRDTDSGVYIYSRLHDMLYHISYMISATLSCYDNPASALKLPINDPFQWFHSRLVTRVGI